MRKLVLGALAALALSTTAANAEWMTTVEEDLFSEGSTATMIGLISLNSSIYATCNADSVTIAYVEAAGDASEVTEPIELGEIVFKGDNSERHLSKTSIYRHNNGYVGFTFDDTDRVVDVIRDIGKADSKISVGLNLVLSDKPMTVSVSARGSSKAVKSFFEACGIEE